MKFIITLILISAVLPLNSHNLNDLAIKYSSDKGSAATRNGQPGHDYCPVYERYFSSLKNENISLLEIGFFQGASAFMWQDYFSYANLYFIDIDPRCYHFAKSLSDRCSLSLVDQRDKTALKEWVDSIDQMFDIIIDDGAHTCLAQIASFDALFPRVKPGGFCVIEDLHAGYWHSHTVPTQDAFSIIDFLRLLIDDLNEVGKRTGCAQKSHLSQELGDSLTYYQKSIESIHFYSSLAIIIKR